MLKTFGDIKSNFKLAPPAVTIDNVYFRAHYRITGLLLLVATILVTSRQYIGEHIRCIADKGVPENVMNTFCFFTTTFTVIRDYDDDMVASGNVAHPGVGPYGLNSTVPIQRHAYYQWVPFVLFAQAIMFFLPHLLWKQFEGGRLKNFVTGLQLAAFAYEDKEITVKDKTIPSKQKKEEYIQIVRNAFIEHRQFNRSWSRWLIFCEFLNLFNVVLQAYITNVFLSGKFYSLGVRAWTEGLSAPVTALDEVFPKVTKCIFHKYGPSGGIQSHDAMCIMALNVINEKIYIALWYWLIIMFILSCLALFWRAVTMYFHSRNNNFNKILYTAVYPKPKEWSPYQDLQIITGNRFGDWLFLRYISKNVDGLVFRELFEGFAEEKFNNFVDSKDESDV